MNFEMMNFVMFYLFPVFFGMFLLMGTLVVALLGISAVRYLFTYVLTGQYSNRQRGES